MPSKRHGAQTRKQWLRMRLEIARDKAGAYDVERLLRRVAWAQEYEITFDDPVPVPVIVTIDLQSSRALDINGLLLADNIEVDIE